MNAMNRSTIIDSDINKMKLGGDPEFIDDDIVMLDNLHEAPIPHDPRRMNFILVGLCTQGEARLNVDTLERVITPGDVIIISDRHVIDSFSGSDDLEALCILISNKFFNEIIRNMSDLSTLFLFSRNNPVISLTEKEHHTFEEYFVFIKQRVGDETNHFRKPLVTTLLLAMFYDLSNAIFRYQQAADQKQSRADAIFARFIRLLEKHFTEERRVSFYAKLLCITPKYLSETVKQVSKRTPNEWIDNYVTAEIRVLLKNSNKSIKEIAEALHFPNQSFLGKYFKEHTGMSPSEYRRK